MSNFEQAVKKQQERMNDIKLPKKTADEMFEELDYTINLNSNEFCVAYEHDNGNAINFYLKEKEVGMDLSYTNLYVELHLAIHQKLFELGWIK